MPVRRHVPVPGKGATGHSSHSIRRSDSCARLLLLANVVLQVWWGVFSQKQRCMLQINWSSWGGCMTAAIGHVTFSGCSHTMLNQGLLHVQSCHNMHHSFTSKHARAHVLPNTHAHMCSQTHSHHTLTPHTHITHSHHTRTPLDLVQCARELLLALAWVMSWCDSLLHLPAIMAQQRVSDLVAQIPFPGAAFPWHFSTSLVVRRGKM